MEGICMKEFDYYEYYLTNMLDNFGIKDIYEGVIYNLNRQNNVNKDIYFLSTHTYQRYVEVLNKIKNNDMSFTTNIYTFNEDFNEILNTYACWWLSNYFNKDILPSNLNVTKRYILNKNLIPQNELDYFDETCKDEIFRRMIEISDDLFEMSDIKLFFVDYETTGLTSPRPVQTSYILTDYNLNIIKAKNIFTYQSAIETDASDIHGLTSERLIEIGAGSELQLIDELDDIFRLNPIFMSHNVRFDMEVTKLLYNNNGRQLDDMLEVCSYRRRGFFNNKFINNKLGTIFSFYYPEGMLEEDYVNIENMFGVNARTLHNASYDVYALYKIYSKNKYLLFDTHNLL